MDQNLTPLVSVVIPAYNVAKYVRQALDSALSQDYAHLEIVAVDDGSSDQTWQILQEYANRPQVRLIQHPKNMGIVAARRTALEHATGEYIAVLDADDYWLDKTKISQQVNFLLSHPSHILVGTQASLVNETGQTTGWLIYPTTDKKIRNLLLFKDYFIHSSIMFRRDSYLKVGGYLTADVGGVEDYSLVLRLGQIGQMANLPIVATAYRLNPMGISQKKRGLQLAQSLAVIRRHKDDYPHYWLGWLKRQVQIILTR